MKLFNLCSTKLQPRVYLSVYVIRAMKQWKSTIAINSDWHEVRAITIQVPDYSNFSFASFIKTFSLIWCCYQFQSTLNRRCICSGNVIDAAPWLKIHILNTHGARRFPNRAHPACCKTQRGDVTSLCWQITVYAGRALWSCSWVLAG